MTSCNALVYEAIQRVYRNAVVTRIRSGMQAAYPDDFEDRITSRFGSWKDNVRAAADSAITGVVTHPTTTSSTISMSVTSRCFGQVLPRPGAGGGSLP
jgi:hypothetical protein